MASPIINLNELDAGQLRIVGASRDVVSYHVQQAACGLRAASSAPEDSRVRGNSRNPDLWKVKATEEEKARYENVLSEFAVESLL